jgi:DNA-binding NarL/FixJ family response regulator
MKKVEIPALKPKHLRILQYLADGLTAADVGKKMNLSRRTIEGHIREILLEFDEKKILRVIIFLYKNGIIK